MTPSVPQSEELKMAKVKIFIPLICYNRSCHADYMFSMMGLISHFQSSFFAATFYPIFFESLISRARNAAVAEFLSNRKFKLSNAEDNNGESHHSPLHKSLSKIEMPSLLFFLGILTT